MTGRRWPGRVGAAVLAAAAGVVAAAQPAGSYRDWLEYAQGLVKDPSLVRLYTFGELSEASQAVENRAPAEAPLVYRAVATGGQSDEQPTLVEGRWPERKALRLDRAAVVGPAFQPGGGGFTVAAWLKTLGSGSLHDQPVPSGGTLLSAGSGYYSGWRVTILYPEARLGFEIGRPRGSVALRGEAMPVGSWHHLAAVWDRKQMRLYLDGLLVGRREYDGPYYHADPPVFRVGYAGFGWGSAIIVVDEVAAWSRALAPAEIFRLAYFWKPVPERVVERFVAAEAALAAGETGRAAAGYSAIVEDGSSPPAVAAAARLRLGECLARQWKPAEAAGHLLAVARGRGATEGLRAVARARLAALVQSAGASLPAELLEDVLGLPGLSSRQRFSIHLRLARLLRAGGENARAAEHERAALATPGLTARDRLGVRLQVAHGLAAAGKYEAARADYRAIATSPDAPAHWRSYARLCMARTYLRERNFAAAAEQFRAVAAMADAPPTHRWEAEECIREVERMQAGKTPRDPAWSRVRLPRRPRPGLVLYVAPDGSDGNDGSEHRPFATLRRARDAIRELRRQKGLPKGGVEVRLAPGHWEVSETLELTSADSGTAAAPIVYRSARPGAASICGGVRLRGFAPVRDPAVVARLPEQARGKVVAVDLKALGITDFGELKPHGMHYGAPPTLELFFNGRPMPMARWPNRGFVRVDRVIEPGGDDRLPVFEVHDARLRRWAKAGDIWVLGYFKHLWADDSLPVARLDAAAGRVYLGVRPGYRTVLRGAPCRFFNLLEEIDEPGEWYLDRSSGVLYFYPPSDPSAADVHLSMLTVPFVVIRGASWVRFEGLVFEYGRGDGLVIDGGNDCLLAGCTIRCLGGNAVNITGGRRHGIFGCDIYSIGGRGTRVAGGDRKTLTPGEHFVENCRIYDFSRLKRTYAPAVLLEGVGNRIAHNVIHDSPGHGIRIEGNDHVVEFNEVYRVCLETDDQGGLDIWGNPTYRGNVFRYNFWHDIGDPNYIPPCGRAGIRLDDAISGTVIYGNVFLRCSQARFGAVQIHGGKENIVENNIFVDCRYAISFSPWGPKRWKQYLSSQRGLRQTRQEVDVTSPPYIAKYPSLAHLADNADVNMVWRNIVWRCGQFLTRDRGIQDLMDNFITAADPGFADADGMNFALRPDAPALQAIGFRPIPFEEIGLYEHPLRAR